MNEITSITTVLLNETIMKTTRINKRLNDELRELCAQHGYEYEAFIKRLMVTFPDLFTSGAKNEKLTSANGSGNLAAL